MKHAIHPKHTLLLVVLAVGLIGATGFIFSPVSAQAPALPEAQLTQATGVAYYVATNGSDSNPGTQAQPWKTIQKAANTMVAGDTVYVLAGNYGGNSGVFQKVKITKSGSAGQQITYQAVGTVLTQGFLVSADYITIKDFDVEDPHDHRIANSTSHDYRGGTGIFVEGSYAIIEDNYIHGSVWGGIILSKNGNFQLPSNSIIRNNKLFRNGMAGIDVSGRNNLIEGNEIWATLQHHPGNIEHATAGYLDADGIRFFGQGHIIRKNSIHDINYGAPGVNLDPNDPNNIYNVMNDYNDNPHIDCFQTWADQYHETAQNIIFEQNHCENLQSQASKENGHGFMLAGGANNITIRNNIIKAYGGVNTGGTGNAHHLYIYNNLWVNNLAFSQFWPFAIGLENAPYSQVNNNIFYNQPYHTIFATGDTTGQEVDYNLAFNNNGSTADCMRVGDYVCANPSPAHDKWNVDPRFTNPGSDDYHLQASSSAIDAGVGLSITNDYDGNPRPQMAGFDIGAIEFSSESGPTTASLSASPTNQQVKIDWTTNLETNLAGFNLYRSQTQAGEGELLNPELIPAQFPGELLGGSYSWLDTPQNHGRIYYRLEAVSPTFARTSFAPVMVSFGYNLFLPAITGN